MTAETSGGCVDWVAGIGLLLALLMARGALLLGVQRLLGMEV